MFDANKLLGRVINGSTASGFLGGLVGGGAVGALKTKRGRKMAKSALKLGGIAAIGALAYHAYNKYKADQAGTSAGANAAAPAPTPSVPAELTPPPADSGFLPAATDNEGTQSFGVTLIRAMIAAAKADGEVDATEGQRLFSEMERLDLDAEEKSFLLGELSRPVDIDAIVGAATSPQLATEIYTASLMAIDVSNQAESSYLQLLASRLNLEPGLVNQLQNAVAESTAHA